MYFPYTSLHISVQKLFWIKMIVNNPEQPWLSLFEERFNINFVKLLKNSMNTQFMSFDPFYDDLLDMWSELRSPIKGNILGEMVAYNPNITIGCDIIRNKYLFKNDTTLNELLNYLGFNLDVILIDYNGTIIQRQMWKTIQIQNQDKLEILTLAGGG